MNEFDKRNLEELRRIASFHRANGNMKDAIRVRYQIKQIEKKGGC